MLTIYAVSDSIGETAEQVAQAAASQFDDEIEVKRVPYIKTLEDVEELIGEIREINNVMIVSTIIIGIGAAKIYRAGVTLYGNAPSFKKVIGLLKKQA